MSQDWRRSYAYFKWRVSVIRRDKTCKNCDRRKDRHAHHIENAAHAPEKRFDVKNGITLCHRCHWMLHNIIRPNYRFKTGPEHLALLKAITLLVSKLPEAPSYYKKPKRKK